MPSLLPGFEYDIFISYRQKDNKGDHWVTEFVNALKTELEATFKEDVSIYFDENPHDGLHEHHDVDGSLREKLKSLIFIPILSRTYCDDRSFAFEHEFKPFVQQASGDALGLKVKLPGGNVASRVLPVRIHELDAEDVKAFESVTGSVLRPIDFVYQEAGVNRPLKPSDNKSDNLNKTDYRNQVNKVANAIRELVAGMRNPVVANDASRPSLAGQPIPAAGRPSRKKIIWAAVAAAVLALAAWTWLTYFSGKLDAEGKGIAVIPFKNLTGDESRDDFGVGIALEVSNKLALTRKFDFTTSLAATLRYQKSDTPPKAIGDELNVDYILTGYYQADGPSVNVTAELTDASNGRRIWSLPYRSQYDSVFDLQHKIASRVMERFSMTDRIDERPPTENLEAYRHYLKGMQIVQSTPGGSAQQFKAAVEFKRAAELDSNFLSAYANLIMVYGSYYAGNGWDSTSVDVHQVKKYHDYILTHFAPSWESNMAQGNYSYYVKADFDKALELYRKVEDENPSALTPAFGIYGLRLKYDEAINRALKNLQQDPVPRRWSALGGTLLMHGDYENAEICLKKVYELNPTFFEFGLYTLKINQNRIEELRDEIKPTDKLYRAHLLQQKRDHAGVIRYVDSLQLDSVFTIDSRNVFKTISFYLMNQDDSARHYARMLPVAFNAGGNSQRSSWGFASISYLRCGILCDEKGMDRSVAVTYSRYSREDLQHEWGAKTNRIHYYALCGEYTRADSLLKALNRDYPQIGNYIWLNAPIYDRIKREYPPINETIKNLKYPPKIMDEKLRKELEKLV